MIQDRIVVASSPDLTGILIYHRDETTTFISESDIYHGSFGKANWSIELTIADRKINTNIAPVTNQNIPRYDGDILAEQDQTFYRLPVIREVIIDEDITERIDFRPMGIYQEHLLSVGDKGPIVQLVKIG